MPTNFCPIPFVDPLEALEPRERELVEAGLRKLDLDAQALADTHCRFLGENAFEAVSWLFPCQTGFSNWHILNLNPTDQELEIIAAAQRSCIFDDLIILSDKKFDNHLVCGIFNWCHKDGNTLYQAYVIATIGCDLDLDGLIEAHALSQGKCTAEQALAQAVRDERERPYRVFRRIGFALIAMLTVCAFAMGTPAVALVCVGGMVTTVCVMLAVDTRREYLRDANPFPILADFLPVKELYLSQASPSDA